MKSLSRAPRNTTKKEQLRKRLRGCGVRESSQEGWAAQKLLLRHCKAGSVGSGSHRAA